MNLKILLYLFGSTCSSLLFAASESDKAIIIPKSPDMTLWKLLIDTGWVIIPLLSASFIAVVLVLFCFFNLRSSRIASKELKQSLESKIQAKDFGEVWEISRKHPALLARVMESTSAFLKSNPQSDFQTIREVAQAEGSRQVASLNQQVTYLMDIGVLAPMLGLFGTVVGILRSFNSIAGDSAAVAMRATLLAGGISQALVSTAVGLLVGIAAMFFYSYFRGKVQLLISELENSATVLVAQMGLQLKK